MSNSTESPWVKEMLIKLNENGDRLAIIKKDLRAIEKRLSNIQLLLGWLRWIAGGVIAIALILILNIIYSFY